MANIFITGGAGYCGSKLVPYLLSKSHRITVYDKMYFGNFLPEHKNLKIIEGDIRDTEKLEKSCRANEYFISLACISNDASFELNEELSTSVNMTAFEPMVVAAKKSGIKRFIYASSSSVYGVKKEKNVFENSSLEPLTEYSKFKAYCEEICLKYHSKNFEVVILRPATVCGVSNRQRFDLVVNRLKQE